MEFRPLCRACGVKPAAVNYKKGTDVHYRTRCDSCTRKNRGLKPHNSAWRKAGYKKKPHCEKCGFKAKYKEQLFVYYIDGNLHNNILTNLKTICANCQFEVAREGLGWRQGDLIPDF